MDIFLFLGTKCAYMASVTTEDISSSLWEIDTVSFYSAECKCSIEISCAVNSLNLRIAAKSAAAHAVPKILALVH
jgi:hypothetical protein